MDKIKKALIIAKKYHKGQKRKVSGEDYIEHPKRVAELVSEIVNNEDLICVALLHDVIENFEKIDISSSLKLKELEKEIRELSPKILNQVRILSNFNADYNDYIKKITKNKRLKIIKICDIIDNLCSNPSEKQIEKYKQALVILLK